MNPLRANIALADCSVTELLGNSFHPCALSVFRWKSKPALSCPGGVGEIRQVARPLRFGAVDQREGGEIEDLGCFFDGCRFLDRLVRARGIVRALFSVRSRIGKRSAQAAKTFAFIAARTEMSVVLGWPIL